MGFALQSLSPSQSRARFRAVALLPFLTSRPTALRTTRSRYPATSGLCSLGGSVLPDGRSRQKADALMGFPQRFPRLTRPLPGCPGSRHVDRLLSETTCRIERLSTRTCPRLLPTTEVPRRKPDRKLTDPRHRYSVRLARGSDPPQGTRLSVSEETSVRCRAFAEPGSCLPGDLPTHTPLCQRETFERAGPFGASSGFHPFTHRGELYVRTIVRQE